MFLLWIVVQFSISLVLEGLLIDLKLSLKITWYCMLMWSVLGFGTRATDWACSFDQPRKTLVWAQGSNFGNDWLLCNCLFKTRTGHLMVWKAFDISLGSSKFRTVTPAKILSGERKFRSARGVAFHLSTVWFTAKVHKSVVKTSGHCVDAWRSIVLASSVMVRIYIFQ